jgi:alkylated DNA repair dioxygenase AlkB
MNSLDLHAIDYRTLIDTDGSAVLYPEFLAEDEANELLHHCLTNLPWRSETIMMYGKPVMQPRLTYLTGVAGLSYRYSGRTMNPEPLTPLLQQLMHRMTEFCNVEFTTALLNLYRNGSDSMGWHRDNERSLGPNPTIASISLGATRLFKLRHRASSHQPVSVPLPHGSALVMKGALQEHWYHCVPKQRGVQEPRVNITLRKMLRRFT